MMKRRLPAVLAVALLLPAALAVLPRETPAVGFPALRNAAVSFDGGTFRDTTFEDVTYVSAEFLAALLGAVPDWDPDAQQLRLRDAQGRRWTLTLDNPFASVDDKVFNLTYPVRRGPERVYVPLHPTLRLLRARFGIDLSPGTAASAPRAETGTSGRVTGMTLEEFPGGAVLRIRSEPGARWQGVLARPHFIVRAFGGTLDTTSVPARLDGAGPLQSAEARQQGTTAQFTLRLRGARDSAELTQDVDGWRVTVRSPAALESAPRGTIIVDAGHGGKDPGAVVKGVREADVNLAVARLLRTELERRGYKVLLTRDADAYISLQDRPRFASENKGDLFVSLHCNSVSGPASRLAAVTGHVAYILREAENEEDKAIARRENMAAEEQSGKKKTEISPLEWILLEHQLNLYSKQSEGLAEAIVRSFAGFEIPRYSTGARQAGFFVLVGAYMPAVLYEMGFLTNDHDRRVLASRNGQQEIARRLAAAIDAFQGTRK